jgi:Flp pilus assembly protein TadD
VIENCERSLALAREIGLREVEAEDLRLLGVARKALGDDVLADDYFRQSLELARELHNPTGQQAALDRLVGTQK